MCMSVLPECISVHHTSVWCYRAQERTPDHWELELQTVGLRIEPEASGRIASTLLSHLYDR